MRKSYGIHAGQNKKGLNQFIESSPNKDKEEC